MASKRRNKFYENKKQETTEIGRNSSQKRLQKSVERIFAVHGKNTEQCAHYSRAGAELNRAHPRATGQALPLFYGFKNSSAYRAESHASSTTVSMLKSPQNRWSPSGFNLPQFGRGRAVMRVGPAWQSSGSLLRRYKNNGRRLVAGWASDHLNAFTMSLPSQCSEVKETAEKWLGGAERIRRGHENVSARLKKRIKVDEDYVEK
ncbi:hypothetical protein AAG570_000056 [Ranatra chinensis]|uniref:Uncharacterized protein n=1 Tax=Ranatra chinensis TaxID=642074 RepID=A0ABD0YVZ4_9HEMI